jgi:hypothetical protein
MGRPRTCDCGICAKCKKRAYMNEWYARKSPAERRAWVAGRDPERVRAYDRKRGGGRGKRPSRLHVNANQAIYRARKKGLIVPEPCLFCDNLNVVAHHHDYSKPFDVTWLCRHHHGRIHTSAS